MIDCSTCGGHGIYDPGDVENGPRIEFCDCAAGLCMGLVHEGLAPTMNEAAHMLVDMGEIDSSTHADLLTPDEAERIYP